MAHGGKACGISVRLAIQVEQVLPGARTGIELVATVLNGLIRERGQNRFGNAPVAQTRFDAGLLVQFTDATGGIAASKQRGEMLDAIRHSGRLYSSTAGSRMALVVP